MSFGSSLVEVNVATRRARPHKRSQRQRSRIELVHWRFVRSHVYLRRREPLRSSMCVCEMGSSSSSPQRIHHLEYKAHRVSDTENGAPSTAEAASHEETCRTGVQLPGPGASVTADDSRAVTLDHKAVPEISQGRLQKTSRFSIRFNNNRHSRRTKGGGHETTQPSVCLFSSCSMPLRSAQRRHLRQLTFPSSRVRVSR